MNNSVFDFDNYKEYLNHVFTNRPKRGRGERNRLALAMGCNNTYVSQVLNGSQDFSLEQAAVINEYLAHSGEEGRFFLLLVLVSRSGNALLKSHFSAEIKRFRLRRAKLKNRLEYEKTLKIEDQLIYYSKWYYSAIHVLLSVPKFRKKDAISQYLELPIQTVSEVLDYLLRVGLAIQSNDEYLIGTKSLHLSDHSPMISQHHMNWHVRAIDSLDRVRSNDLHYSSVITVSKADAIKIRDVLHKTIDEIRKIVRASNEEGAYCYRIDLFEIGSEK